MNSVTSGELRIGNRKEYKCGFHEYDMSEELKQRGLVESGIMIGKYEFYNIGATTLNQLKTAGIINKKDYGKYGSRKPDALILDKRDKKNIKVILVIEHKDGGKFITKKDRKSTIEQCNDLAQILNADLGLATDNSSFIWFNPKQEKKENEYFDSTTKTKRSYSIICDENGKDFIKELIIDQKENERDITKINFKTRLSLQHIDRLLTNVSCKNSQIKKEETTDPSILAKQIWQDVWSVSGATPEKCLYTFVELFIFKYLSDLDILDEDDKGNKVNFNDIYALQKDKAFKNYSDNVRPWLKKMFPENPSDNTTIINGTILNPNVPEHSHVFHKILKKFYEFGELKNIDPKFKSKIFEDFMKQSISKKNWGQFFTPRNIIDFIIEISGIETLPKDSLVCDPACGVGGFILEPIKMKENGLDFYYETKEDGLKSRFNFIGYDKGFEKEERLTIILAKANMLIFLSDLLKENKSIPGKFADLFNKTFLLLTDTILGTLNKTEIDKYDLILSNPPYVTSGSSNYKDAIKNDQRLKDFYKTNGIGVEGLFIEWIIRSLKPAKKAFVIVPDGIMNRLNDKKIRGLIKEECIIDAIISLPINSFYTTPKKTYILAITKKAGETEIKRKEEIQIEPVFTYLASHIGETLDVNRFPEPDKNDLIEAVSLFNQFKGAKKDFKTESKRCKIQNINKFNPDGHWSVDRWWNKEEKIELGIEEEEIVISLEEFEEKIEDSKNKIEELRKLISGIK